jgi:hypothetical protein
MNNIVVDEFLVQKDGKGGGNMQTTGHYNSRPFSAIRIFGNKPWVVTPFGETEFTAKEIRAIRKAIREAWKNHG